jgi:hypothetical protein
LNPHRGFLGAGRNRGQGRSNLLTVQQGQRWTKAKDHIMEFLEKSFNEGQYREINQKTPTFGPFVGCLFIINSVEVYIQSAA